MGKIGCSSIIINPPVGVLMSGFAPLRAYQKKHSDLWCRATVIVDCHETLFLQLDTIAVDSYFYNRIVKRLAKYRFLPDRIIVSATHTHAGPVGLVQTNEGIFTGLQHIFGSYDESLVEELLEKIETVVQRALSALVEIKGIRFGTGNLPGIGSERHDRTLPGDDRLLCWCYESVAGEKVLFYNFACHPTILNGDCEYLSSDFPGAVDDELVGEYEMVSFINGSCGDISTRFTRSGDRFESVNGFGKTIADKIRTLLQEADSEKVSDLLIRQNTYKLATKEFDSEEAAWKEFENARQAVEAASDLSGGAKRAIESFMEGARTNLALVRSFKGISEVELAVTFLNINGRIMVTMPAELFSSLSNELRATKDICFLGYTNGYSLYIADETAYDKGYYEALSSIYEKGQGEILMAKIKEDIEQWKKETLKG